VILEGEGNKTAVDAPGARQKRREGHTGADEERQKKRRLREKDVGVFQKEQEENGGAKKTGSDGKIRLDRRKHGSTAGGKRGGKKKTRVERGEPEREKQRKTGLGELTLKKR